MLFVVSIYSQIRLVQAAFCVCYPQMYKNIDSKIFVFDILDESFSPSDTLILVPIEYTLPIVLVWNCQNPNLTQLTDQLN